MSKTDFFILNLSP